MKFKDYEEWKNSIENETAVNTLFVNMATSGLPKKFYGQDYNYKDLESFDSCRVVQIAWRVSNAGNNISHRSFYIKPNQFDISDGAYNIHKITKDFALENGVEIQIMFDQLLADIKTCNLIVSHGMEFDHNVLMSELYRSKANKDLMFIIQYIDRLCTGDATKGILKLPTKSTFDAYKMPKFSELYAFCFKKELPEYDLVKYVECLEETFNYLKDKYKFKKL